MFLHSKTAEFEPVPKIFRESKYGQAWLSSCEEERMILCDKKGGQTLGSPVMIKDEKLSHEQNNHTYKASVFLRLQHQFSTCTCSAIVRRFSEILVRQHGQGYDIYTTFFISERFIYPNTEYGFLICSFISIPFFESRSYVSSQGETLQCM